MKLAEALMERADLNSKIELLRSRIEQNAIVQEGEQPNEEPLALLQELDEAIERLSYLIARINLTNCVTKVEGKTLTEIIAEKDSKNLQLNAYRSIAYEAGQNTRRARGTEIKMIPTLSVSELRKKGDEISKEIRLLDNTLQLSNWQIDLIE